MNEWKLYVACLSIILQPKPLFEIKWIGKKLPGFHGNEEERCH